MQLTQYIFSTDFTLVEAISKKLAEGLLRKLCMQVLFGKYVSRYIYTAQVRISIALIIDGLKAYP